MLPQPGAEAPAEDGYDHADTDPGYAALSPLAVLALGLGLASPLAALGPVLLAIPAAAVLAALAATRRITRSGGTVGGRGVALLGLGLAVASAAGVVSQGLAYNRLMVAQASPVADAWVRAAHAGDWPAAERLMRDPTEAPSDGAGAPEPDAGHDHGDHTHAGEAHGHEGEGAPTHHLADHPVGRRIAALPDPSVVRCLRGGALQPSGGAGRRAMDLVYDLPAEPGQPPGRALFRMERVPLAAEGSAAWRVAGVHALGPEETGF